MSGTSSAQGSLTVYDESALCSGAFKLEFSNYTKEIITSLLEYYVVWLVLGSRR